MAVLRIIPLILSFLRTVLFTTEEKNVKWVVFLVRTDSYPISVIVDIALFEDEPKASQFEDAILMFRERTGDETVSVVAVLFGKVDVVKFKDSVMEIVN